MALVRPLVYLRFSLSLFGYSSSLKLLPDSCSPERPIRRGMLLDKHGQAEREDDNYIEENDPCIQDAESPYVHQRPLQSLVFTDWIHEF